MKKFAIFASAVLLAFSLLVVSCKNDSDDSGNSGGGSTSIVGIWKGAEWTVQFNSNGTLTVIEQDGDSENGDYNFNKETGHIEINLEENGLVDAYYTNGIIKFEGTDLYRQ